MRTSLILDCTNSVLSLFVLSREDSDNDHNTGEGTRLVIATIFKCCTPIKQNELHINI